MSLFIKQGKLSSTAHFHLVLFPSVFHRLENVPRVSPPNLHSRQVLPIPPLNEDGRFHGCKEIWLCQFLISKSLSLHAIGIQHIALFSCSYKFILQPHSLSTKEAC